MANKKTTKRALLLGFLSVLLCVTMVMGTTFAWFTDSVVSMNNIITSGNLDIELEYSKDMLTWKTVNEQTELFDDALWEPGHTQVVYMRLVNSGSLALKYHLGINIVSEVTSVNVNGDVFKLSDYIYFDVMEDVTAPYADREEAIGATSDSTIIGTGYSMSGSMLAQDEAKCMALVVYMPETVGNEANHAKGQKVPTIKLGVNVFATQFAHEEDSFGNDYDADALPCDIIATPETIDEILASVKPGTVIGLSDGKYGKITLTQNNLTLVSNTAVVDYINLNGKDDCKIIGLTFRAEGAQMTYEMSGNDNREYGLYANIVGAEKSNTGADRVYIANCTFTGTPNDVNKYAPIAFCEKNRKSGSMKGFTVTDCKFETSALYYIFSRYMGGNTLNSITNNTFGTFETTVNTAVYSGMGRSNITVAGNTFFNWTERAFTTTANGSNIAPVVLTVKNNNFMQVAVLDSIDVIGVRDNHLEAGSSVVFEDNKANNGVDSFFGPDMDGEYQVYTMNSSGSFKPAYDDETLKSGGNLILTKDIYLQEAETIIDKDSVILLNGFSIYASRGLSTSNKETPKLSVLYIDGVNVVFDGVGNVVNTASDGGYAVALFNGANVTVKGGNYYTYYDAFYVRHGELYIEDGFFQAYDDKTGEPDWTTSAIPCHISKVINCHNGAYLNYINGNTDAEYAKVVTTGGTFVNDDPSNLQKGNGLVNQSYLPEGYHVLPEVQANGVEIWYTVLAD